MKQSTIAEHITALASATGGKTPPPPGGEAPGRRGAQPPDSREQGAKPPVRWKFVKHGPRKTFSK